MSIFPTHDISLNRYYYSFYSYNPSEDANVIKSFTYDNTQTLVETKDISFNTKSPTEMITFLENSGTNPYAVGKSGAADFRSMDLAFGGVYKKGFKETQRQALMTYLNTTYKNIHARAVQEYAVTVANSGSGNKYYLDENGPAYTVFAPTSGIYVFDQSDSTNVTHPLVIGETDGAGTYYSSMITEGTIGSLNGYTIVDISAGTPDLYYYCSAHSGMGGQLLNFVGGTSYTVTAIISATYGQFIYQVAELPNYYTDGLGLIFNVGTRYVVNVSALNDTSYNAVFGNATDDSLSIVSDTSIVNKIGDIIYVTPQQTLYMFDQTTTSMTKPRLVSIQSTSNLASPGSSFTITVQNLSDNDYTYTVNLTGELTTADLTNTVLTGSIPSNSTIQYTNSVLSTSVATGNLVFSINNTENTQYTVSFTGPPIYINVTADTGTVLTTQSVYWVQMSLKDGKNTIGSRQEKPYITLLSGNTYLFKYPTSYRLRLSETPPSGISGTDYSNGVTIDDVNGELLIVMTESKTLYYYSLDLVNMGPEDQTSLYETYSITRNFYDFNSSNFNTTTLEFTDLVSNNVQANINLDSKYYPSSFLERNITNTDPNEPKEYTTSDINRVPGNTSLRLFRVDDSTYEISAINSITSIDGISINFWIYCKKFNTNIDNAGETFVSITDNINDKGMVAYYNNHTQNALYMFYGTGPGGYTSFPSETFDRNGMQWTMFTFTLFMNSSNLVTQSFYRDGEMVGTFSWTRNTADFNPHIALNISACGKFQGYLDQYTIHNKTLTASEIRAIYNDTGNIQYM